jgi:chromosome segregation protein
MTGKEPRVLRAELADKGSHYYRADFQVHTPRDTQWNGGRPQNESERKIYADEFVAACRDRGLHAVAITDHHDFALFPYIHAAAAAETTADGSPIAAPDRLVVFPGLELTLSVPCQAIMILDADFPHSKLDDVLKALHFDPIDPALQAIPQTTTLQDSGDIAQLHEKLDKNTWLKGRYIILPNVTPSGSKSLLRTSFQAKYNDMPCVGGYLDGGVGVFGKKLGEKKILDGKDKAWGNKRLALFQTSDARSDDFADLGKCATWVKWSRPTAEALRQACLAVESRISQDEPPTPNVWISRVVVSASKFMGRVDIVLNPQYTALIGGRGTGKSTVLDYVRWALCDQPAQATEDDEVADPRVRQRRLIDATLAPIEGAHVEVHCTINGIAHVVRRHGKSGEVQLKVGDGPLEPVRESVVQSLLPVQAYSQKQLSSVAIRLDELLRFVTSPIRSTLEDVDRRIAEVSGRLRENYGTLQRFRNLQDDIAKSELRIASLAGQAQALRDGLSGLSEADRAVLDGKASYDGVKAAAAVWGQQTELAGEAVDDALRLLEGALSRLEVSAETPEAARSDAETVVDQARAAILKLKQSISSAKDQYASSLVDSVVGAANRLADRLAKFDEEYAAVKQRSSAHQVKLRELSGLENQQKEASDLLRSQQGELAGLGDPADRHTALRSELAALSAQRSKALRDQCSELSESSGGLIRASLAVGRGFDPAQEKFKGLIAGSNVRSAKVDALFAELARDSDPVDSWERLLGELELLMRMEPDADIRSEQTPVLTRLGFSVSDQKKVAPRITPDGWLDLSLVPLTDHPEFEYQSKEGEFIPFSSASAGQQATALLTTLLSQEGTPLIIDQPEDDLDSETVQDIVSKIWSSKGSRQLLFASHNANLVVNGDADLVLVCAYAASGDQSAGEIKLEGAIDIDDVRREITTVMEGGERAFRLRKEKYGF